MFLTPGSRMEGRKGRRGKRGGFVKRSYYGSSQTITIPNGATRARVTMYGASQGGSSIACVTTAGANGTVGVKALKDLIQGQTMVLTLGAAGAAGNGVAGGTGGTSTLAAGSQNLATLTIAGAPTNTATNFDSTIGGYPIGPAPGGAAGINAGSAASCVIDWYV